MEDISSQKLIQLQSKGDKLLVDFWAPWCGPCKHLIPRLENLESKYPNIKFVKINVDENPELAMNLDIRTVPTVMVFVGENLVSRTTGANQDIIYTNILDKL